MIPVWVPFVVATICVLTEAFFSGSEIALVSADRALLRSRAAMGHKGAQAAEAFLEKPQWFLATTLLGTNLSTVTSATVVTLAVVQHMGEDSEFLAVVMLSPAILIFGEVVPKTLFQQKGWTRWRPASPSHYACSPSSPRRRWCSWGKFVDLAGRVFKLGGRRGLITRDELLLLLESDDAERSKSITPEERRMVSNLIGSGQDTVYDIMVPLSEVALLPATASFDEVLAAFTVKQHTRMPVYAERVDRIVSLVHAFDVLRAQTEGTPLPAGELGRPPLYVPESKPTGDLLRELQKERQHMAVVVDEYGGATGVVTLEDILEEIVGDILDEHDRGPEAIRPDGPGTWVVLARTSIEKVNQTLELELPEGDDYETIAGLLLDRLKRFPREGETVYVEGFRFDVLGATDRTIDEVRLRAAPRRKR